MTDYAALARSELRIHASEPRGPLETWRHTLGLGGINTVPLPPRVVQGTRRLRPRLIRIFIQEFFRVYPEHGRFDWRRLDPYMDALAATGAQLVAAITLKPHALFPAVDHSLWRPNDVAEWQRVVSALVRRYSVERRLVTHWEVGNETDIGENGGTPHLIPDPADYFEFYRMTLPAILEAFPEARVGGPAACWVDNEPLPGFVERCRETGTQLDLVSWHLYNDDPERHAGGVRKGQALVEGLPGRRPELMVTEWNKGFDRVSVEDLAFEPRRAALVAASILAMLDAGLDWSFYYHLWDQVCDPEEFRPFFSPEGVQNMVRHWNEVPHRFGLFGVGEEVRPQYFVYEMLSRLGDERLGVEGAEAPLRVLGGRDGDRVSAMVVNAAPGGGEDRLLTLDFAGLAAGHKRLVIHRIDRGRNWRAGMTAFPPAERRQVVTGERFQCQVYSPADSVALITLEPADSQARNAVNSLGGQS